MKTRTKIIILSAGFVVAICLVLYPFAANIWNSRIEQQMIVQYEESVSEITNEEYAELIEAAIAWNEELISYIEPSYFPDGMTNNEIYESLLDIDGNGMIGYVVIPKIDVSLPIYHYTTDDVLQKGAGHMEASALPVGGESTHCVITAHRGLPTAEMFTNLDQLEIGDVFYLKVLDQTIAYEVYEIVEVDPDETSYLLPQAGEDLCTLVTCTPYGVNTQRLLVTGRRVEIEEEEEVSGGSAVLKSIKNNWILAAVAAVEIFAYILLLVIIFKRRQAA